MDLSSFGLHADGRDANEFQKYFLDEVNECVINCGLTLEDAMSLPIAKRQYWIQETHRKKNEASKRQQGPGATSPDGRQVLRR